MGKLNIERAITAIRAFDVYRKEIQRDVREDLPVGSVVEIRRGKDNTKRQGWTGPYEIRAHILHSVNGLILVNLQTRKIVRFYVGKNTIRQPTESPKS